MRWVVAALVTLALAVPAHASAPAGTGPTGASRSILSLPTAGRPSTLRDVGFDQRLGEDVPLDLRFVDEAGVERKLGDYLGPRPVILLPAYYSCPMLCPLTIDGLAKALKPLSFDVGTEFDVIVASFDPEDGPAGAAKQKAAAVRRYGRDGTENGWHFLTGDEASIRALTESIGFRYALDEKSGEYAHPAGVVILTPTGRISRYLFGLDPAPRDLRLALVESAEQKIGSPIDRVLLFCFQYDPAHGRYSAIALGSMRVLAVLTVAGLGLLIGTALWRERKGKGGGR